MVGILARQDHTHHAGNAGQRRTGEPVNRGLDRGLHVGVQRRFDQVAAPGHLLLINPRTRQVLLDVIAEECAVACRDAAARHLVGLRKHPQRRGLGGAQCVFLLRQVLDHGVQDQVPPGQRAIGVGVRVERAGRLNHARKQGRLLPVQVGGVDAEVRLRRGLHAERVVAERDQVQIASQDLGFGEGFIESERHPDLTQLASRSGFDGRARFGVCLSGYQQLVVLYVLLLDGRTAASADVAGRVAGQSCQGAFPVDPVVVGEALVLDRNDRQLHGVGDLVGGHLKPAL